MLNQRLREIFDFRLKRFENEANIFLHGMIIPADEALPGIPFEVNSRDWLSMLYYFQLYNDNQKGR